VTVDRFLSRTIVVQASANGVKYNIVQIGFSANDGSLMVRFPYCKHSKGLLSIGNIPAGQATAQVSLEPQGKCTSHKVKYTHHPDGRAHFSEDGKIFTAVVRQSVPLNSAEGHIFTVQAAGLHEFQPATRSKDLAQPTESRANLAFEFGSEFPQAIKIVGQLYHVRTLEARIVGRAPSVVGRVLPVNASGTPVFCVGNPSAVLADMILLLTCEIMPPEKPWSGLIFYGGFDPREHFDDVSHSASFLALSYSIENFEELASRLGSVDLLTPKSSRRA
jgi:hypothetical protein